jgi:hypothetical protein
MYFLTISFVFVQFIRDNYEEIHRITKSHMMYSLTLTLGLVKLNKMG